MTDEETEDTFAGTEPKSSASILAALKKSETAFREWQNTCQSIDEIYSYEALRFGGITNTLDSFAWSDSRLDLFWASMEVLKPATYARPPVPAVAPLFPDNDPLKNTTAELLERSAIASFNRTNIGEQMCQVRDDLLFTNRGVLWLTYEAKDGKQCVDVEHLDRLDFAHEPARYWPEVGWVARRAWLTRKEARKRFQPHSGDAYTRAQYRLQRDRDADRDEQQTTKKAGFWEVWHRADNKVYWVSEGVDVLLDSGEPHLKLHNFFPCPRPAYGTLQRRSLVPVPDWERYAVHFQQVSKMTGRIYTLLDQVRMMGLVGGGGDVADAVQDMLEGNDDQILVRVNSLGNLAESVVWLPLAEIATAIAGLIEARTQLINDFYQLSGISDIMRGATEAEETLGAQQLKSQYGSVRVREKIDELQRVAADAVKIMAEIIAERFTKETLLSMSQMDIPTRAAIEKRIKDIEAGAKKELDALEAKAKEMADQAGEVDPAQAQQAMQEAQQAILAKYAPMLEEAEGRVPIEDVMKLLRDDEVRGFTFNIQSDSTIMTDELQEKATRNEFLTEFTNASQGLMGLMGMGEQGSQLAGEMLKFVLAPYRAGRQLDGAIDAFIDAAPEMAKAAQAASGQGEQDNEALIAANNKLAEAEQMKAQAAMAGVQAKAALDQAESQRKFAELQNKMQTDALKAEQEQQKLQLQLADTAAKAEKTQAEINKLQADTAKILASIGLDVRKQELDEYRAAADEQNRAEDRAMQAENQAIDQQFRERGEQRADMQAMTEGTE